ncbi:hypothetical protein GCM10025783_30440 [Amnibacterium soli]|uniref:Uncharacterized protein n=1 Tax=Amnibacterium soli TaxID=1282736 RepID=A0ABP8ZF99_9MICO
MCEIDAVDLVVAEHRQHTVLKHSFAEVRQHRIRLHASHVTVLRKEPEEEHATVSVRRGLTFAPPLRGRGHQSVDDSPRDTVCLRTPELRVMFRDPRPIPTCCEAPRNG